jgi:hypothetical protein
MHTSIFLDRNPSSGISMQIKTNLSNYLHFGKKSFDISRSEVSIFLSELKLKDAAKYRNEDIEDLGIFAPNRSMQIQIFRIIYAGSKRCVYVRVLGFRSHTWSGGRGRGRKAGRSSTEPARRRGKGPAPAVDEGFWAVGVVE